VIAAPSVGATIRLRPDRVNAAGTRLELMVIGAGVVDRAVAA
jgi:hypothetical protein